MYFILWDSGKFSAASYKNYKEANDTAKEFITKYPKIETGYVILKDKILSELIVKT